MNSGGVLASSPSNAISYAGGFGGNVELKSERTLKPGGTGGTGILSTNSMTIDAGASLNFEFGTNSSLYDQLFTQGGLTLDNSGNSTLNLGLAGAGISVLPGTDTVINALGGLTWDNTHGVTLGTVPTGQPDGTSFSLRTVGNFVQVVVKGPVLQWDPTGNGASSGTISEGGGTWYDGTTNTSPFLDQKTNLEQNWSNTAPAENDVVIGNDSGQAGGVITLGNNIVVPGKIIFGQIFPGFNYSITDGGSGNSLTVGGGIFVNNSAATSTTPSAEIDAPITLSASQTWNVDPGQFLDVKGQLTGNATTLTKIGTGTVFFEHAGGSLATLNSNGGVVILGAGDALGNATLNLDGGGVQWAANVTVTNPINIGVNGGTLGAITGFTATLPQNFSGTNPIFASGTGTTIFSGNLSLASATFTSPWAAAAWLRSPGRAISAQSRRTAGTPSSATTRPRSAASS